MNITKDIRYIGVNDHQIDLFEGQYIVPEGMAYNSYVILDRQIAVMDSVDRHFGAEWLKIDTLNTAPLYPSKLRRPIMNLSEGKTAPVYLGNENAGDPEITD